MCPVNLVFTKGGRGGAYTKHQIRVLGAKSCYGRATPVIEKGQTTQLNSSKDLLNQKFAYTFSVWRGGKLSIATKLILKSGDFPIVTKTTTKYRAGVP